MQDSEKRELQSYREAGLTPRQIKAIKREALHMREYIEWLKEL